MKISDFGKSGPRLVTSGLVCASAADGPAAIQPAAASATKIRRNIPGISILLIDAVCRFSLSWPAGLSRDLYRHNLYRHKSRWQSRGTLHPRDNGVFTNFGKSWRPPALRSQYRNNECVVLKTGPIGAHAMSIQRLASPAITVHPPKRNLLAHIPGDECWPVVGRTLAILADPKGEVERMAAKYGLIYRSRVRGETSISVLGPEANELL